MKAPPRNIHALMPFVVQFLRTSQELLAPTPERKAIFDDKGDLDPLVELDLCIAAMESFFTTKQHCESLLQGRPMKSLFRKPLLEIRKRFRNTASSLSATERYDELQLEIVLATAPIPPTGFQFATLIAKMLAAKVLRDAGEDEAAAKVWN